MLQIERQYKKKEFPQQEPLPKGIYTVELLDIIEKEQPTWETRFKPENEQEMEYVLNCKFGILDAEYRGRFIWMNYVPTYFHISKKNGKNKLFRMVEALQERDLTQVEIVEGFNTQFMNGLIGKQCQVIVEPNEKNDKVFDKITDLLVSKNKKESLNPTEAQTEKELTAEDIPF